MYFTRFRTGKGQKEWSQARRRLRKEFAAHFRGQLSPLSAEFFSFSFSCLRAQCGTVAEIFRLFRQANCVNERHEKGIGYIILSVDWSTSKCPMHSSAPSFTLNNHESRAPGFARLGFSFTIQQMNKISHLSYRWRSLQPKETK